MAAGMETKAAESEFLDHLRAEKLSTQEMRNKLTLQKLTFGTALLGIGSLRLEIVSLNTFILVFLVPFVALVFDLYIMGEDYGVKRIGYYLRRHSLSSLENEWEGFVSAHRDPYAPYAMAILTMLLTAGSGILALYYGSSVRDPLFWAWVGFCLAADVVISSGYQRLRRNIAPREKVTKIGASRALRMRIERAQRAVAKADHCLTTESYREIKALFEFVTAKIPPLERKDQLSPEYGLDEFLACVSVDGAQVGAPEGAVEDFRETALAKPGFKEWFREEAPGETAKPALLPARWLCHTLGLRHGTAHLILSVPDGRDQLLLQVRSTHKTTWPGCYDLPVAGHVDALQSYEDTLRKEAKEELNLDVELLVDLKTLGGYAAAHGSNGGVLQDVEYHRVFSAKLFRYSILSLELNPEEVASLALLSGEELAGMRAAHPEMFAPGLTETLREFP